MSFPPDPDGAETDPLRAEIANLCARLSEAQEEVARWREEARVYTVRFGKSQANARAARHRAHWFRVHLDRTLAAVRLDPPVELGDDPPSSGEYRPVLTDVTRAFATRTFVQEIRRGRALDASLVATVRAMLATGAEGAARSFAQALLTESITADAGAVGCAIYAHQLGLREIGWRRVRDLPTGLLLRTMPVEFIDLAVRAGAPHGRAAVGALNATPADVVSDTDRWGAARAAYAAESFDLANELLGALRERTGDAPDLTEKDEEAYRWLCGWIDRARVARTAEPLEPGVGVVPFGVLTYRNPDRHRCSTNLGDHVQTLAMLGHLARHRGVEFDDGELGGFTAALAARMPADSGIAGPTAKVELHPIERDDSRVAVIPDGTWTIVFGWYMNSRFGETYGMPLDPRIRPLFVSFHVNRRDLLTDDAIAYLRRHAPIGCRDWTTVHLLQAHRIPAFFTGCITTTLDMQYGPLDGVPSRESDLPVAVVDLNSSEYEFPEDPDSYVRSTPVRPGQVVAGDRENLEAAVAELDGYRERYARVATARLHSYLPATALGLDVDFRPRSATDVRFDGLLGMRHGTGALTTMQEGIRTGLADAVGAILGGESEDRVRAIWTQASAAEVARADQRLRTTPPLPPPSFDVDATCRRIRAAATTHPATEPRDGEVVHVAFSLDADFVEQLPVVIESIVSNTTRPVSFWITERGLEAEETARIATAFSEATITFLPCDAVDYGEVRGMLPHIGTLAVMDRLLLPQLLSDVHRCVFHDLDAITVADIGELFDLDLGGTPLAARHSEVRGQRTMLDHVYRAAARLDDLEVSGELRRRVHARTQGDPPAFNAGVMVLDLARMRADDFCAGFIPYVERYSMNDQEVMSCYAGPNVTPLAAEWNLWTKQDVFDRPKLIHWAGPVKPWHEEYTVGVDEWRQVEARWLARRDRAGGPPT